MKKNLFLHFIIIALCCGCSTYKISNCNVSWDTPSESSLGSMPLGNGDIGANVWTEPNGDVLLYISKVDAFNHAHLLPKLGKIRIRLSPALDINSFNQTLHLEDASILISDKDTRMKIYVAANQPVIQIEASSDKKREAQISLEPLRKLTRIEESTQTEGTRGLILDGTDNQINWCYENLSSDWIKNARMQNSKEMLETIKDPLLHRISGCSLQGDDMTHNGEMTLKTIAPTKKIQMKINVLTSQDPIEQWKNNVTKEVEVDTKAHQTYWNEFWQRSYIEITSCGDDSINMDRFRYTQNSQAAKPYRNHNMIDADKNARQITQKYALERFCQAAANRGKNPAPFNGSIFTMDMPTGSADFRKPKVKPANPDERAWARLACMWQNTRHPLWSMPTRGDFDCMKPGLEFVSESLELSKDRCKQRFGVEGCVVPEAAWLGNVGVFNWESMPAHLKYHQLATIETAAMMCKYYDYTQDSLFLNNSLLPWAKSAIDFYANRFTERDEKGKMVMAGVGVAETYQGATNPCTEIGGLKFVLERLVKYPLGNFGQYRKYWQKLLNSMPDVPLREVKGTRLLAVADKYEPARTLVETPELYSVYPFEQVWLGKDSLLDIARQSFYVRNVSLDGSKDIEPTETGGWQASLVQSAYLGLPKETARLATINFNDEFIHWHGNIPQDTPWPNRPRARFPAFWECKMDGTPDNDHGANCESALQSMLLQSDDKKIYLLPAWPENWDVSFKLHATRNTTVECRYKNGKIKKLKVSPQTREKDIINMADKKQRIRTSIEIAMADRNYLFGLPQAEDGQLTEGPATKSWIKKYGYTVNGCKAGPWGNSLYKGKTAYIHIFDMTEKCIKIPKYGTKVENYKSITGKMTVKTDNDYIIISGQPDKTHTIVQIDFAQPLDSLVLNMPSHGSITKSGTIKKYSTDNGKCFEAIFDKQHTIRRYEVTIDNPDFKFGDGIKFTAEYLDTTDNQWKLLDKGNIYGTICSRKTGDTKAGGIRVTANKTITSLDVFE